jgi:hypothetical protein
MIYASSVSRTRPDLMTQSKIRAIGGADNACGFKWIGNFETRRIVHA